MSCSTDTVRHTRRVEASKVLQRTRPPAGLAISDQQGVEQLAKLAAKRLPASVRLRSRTAKWTVLGPAAWKRKLTRCGRLFQMGAGDDGDHKIFLQLETGSMIRDSRESTATHLRQVQLWWSIYWSPSQAESNSFASGWRGPELAGRGSMMAGKGLKCLASSS